MECYPPCATCTGLCKLPLAPEVSRAVRVPDGDTRRAPVSKPGYVEMTCGHYTTPEDQRAYSPSKPKGRRFWCSTCSKWLYQTKRCIDCGQTFGAHHHGGERRCTTCKRKHVGLELLF